MAATHTLTPINDGSKLSINPFFSFIFWISSGHSSQPAARWRINRPSETRQKDTNQRNISRNREITDRKSSAILNDSRRVDRVQFRFWPSLVPVFTAGLLLLLPSPPSLPSPLPTLITVIIEKDGNAALSSNHF